MDGPCQSTSLTPLESDWCRTIQVLSDTDETAPAFKPPTCNTPMFVSFTGMCKADPNPEASRRYYASVYNAISKGDPTGLGVDTVETDKRKSPYRTIFAEAPPNPPWNSSTACSPSCGEGSQCCVQQGGSASCFDVQNCGALKDNCPEEDPTFENAKPCPLPKHFWITQGYFGPVCNAEYTVEQLARMPKDGEGRTPCVY